MVIFIFLAGVVIVMTSFLTLANVPDTKPSTSLPYHQGKEYSLLTKSIDEGKSGNINIRIFFWYGCPHCYQLEKLIDKWQKTLPEKVVLIRVPVIFGQPWQAHARLYYTLTEMQLADKTRDVLFVGAQKESVDLTTPESAFEYLNKQYEIDQIKFMKLYQSFQTNFRIKTAAEQTRNAQLRGVPSLVIDGRYRVNIEKLSDLNEALSVTDFLIKKIIHEQVNQSNILS